MENQFFLDAPMSSWQSLSSAMEIQPTDYLESAFSSMVSSPAASNSNLSNENFMMRELIGKLGEISPQPLMYTNTSSSYSTPLNSPPKLNLPLMVKEKLPSLGKSMGIADFSADPGFAARAAKFSCFGSRSFNDRTRTSQLGINNNGNQMSAGFRSNNPLSSSIPRVSSSPSLKAMVIDRSELANSQEESSITNNADLKASKNSRKRKAIPKDKTNTAKASEESNEKRCKSTESNGNQNDSVKAEEENENAKLPEPPKDYIHVRARRGQATDSHSLAERVRREKISERMKLLQNLVPGCSKVTGKALMLDEIINYVQSLQRQVEFLSMKLASVNTSLDFNVDGLLSKDMFQSNNSLSHQMFSMDSSASAIFGQQNSTLHGNDSISNGTMTPLDSAIRPNLNNHLPPIRQFTQTVPQCQTLCEGDLQTIVEMGFLQNQSREMALLSENFSGQIKYPHES